MEKMVKIEEICKENFYSEKHERERVKDIKEACNLDKNKPLTAVIVKCCPELYLKYVICVYACAGARMCTGFISTQR